MMFSAKLWNPLLLQRSYVNFVKLKNAFQNINQAIYLKYWQDECPANRTLDWLCLEQSEDTF